MNTWDGTLGIETPENVVFGYELAGIGSRFMAAAIDTTLILLLELATVLPLRLVLDGTSIGGAWLIALLGLVAFLFFWGYYIIFEIIWNGQSPGKRRVQLRVIRGDGTPVTVSDSVIRNLVRLVDWLPGFYLVGVVVMFIDSKSRRLGDLAGNTLVVHDREAVTLESLKHRASLPPASSTVQELSSGLPTDRLTPDDFRLAEEFLARRHELTNSAALARQLLAALYRRMDLPLPHELTDLRTMDLLADIARAGRKAGGETRPTV